jgi:hypothetical protein
VAAKPTPAPVAQERVAIPLIVEVIQGTKRNEVKFKDQPEQPANTEVGK